MKLPTDFCSTEKDESKPGGACRKNRCKPSGCVKWERAEASPDTDNLILLADIYGVSLDELLKGEKETESETQSEEPENNAENNSDSDTTYKNQTRFRSNTESMLTQRTVILFTLISGTESMLKIKTVQRFMSAGTEFMLKKTAKQKSIQTKTEMLCMMKALKSINIQSRTAFGNTFRFG